MPNISPKPIRPDAERDMRWRKQGLELLTTVLAHRAHGDRNEAWNNFVSLAKHLGFERMLRTNFTEQEFHIAVPE